MYQALYRKYRPQTLEDICGQEAIVKIIKNSIINNKISHAYLFAGPRGTGKTSLAKVFSKIINCENPHDCTPCGVCVNCTQTNNTDIIEIDAASNNGVDEIRELRSKVNLVPAYGKYKVYIIDEVHMLTTGAFNALLKTLEEPPAHIIFILATTDPHKIPETIISRCQRLDFKKISLEAIVNRLKVIAQTENIEITDEALMEIAVLADGGMRDSLGMLDEAAAYTCGKISEQDIHDINGTLTTKDLKTFTTFLLNNDIENLFKLLDQYNEKGKNFVKLIEEIILYMRNLLIYKKAPNYFSTLNYNLDNYKDVDFSVPTLIKYIELLNECLIDTKNTNNPKLMFELVIIKMLSETDKTNSKLNASAEATREIGNNLSAAPNNSQKINNQKPLSSVENPVNEEPVKPDKQSEIVSQAMQAPLKINSFPPKQDSSIKSNNNQIGENVENSSKTVEKVNNITEKPTPAPEQLELQQNLNQLKQIRIDNTLAKFNKRSMMPIKTQLDKLNDYLLTPIYSKSASIVLDGLLKAASDENIIFMYKTSALANMFNENLIEVEKIIEIVCEKHYKVIAVNQDEWEQIKTEFNGKQRQFTYQPEKLDLKEIFQSKKNEIKELFGDIIEYD